MNKRILLWLVLAAICVAVVGCRSSDEDQGYIVYQAAGPDDKAAPELVVLDADGKELRRIALPDETSLLQPFRFPLSDHVLYDDALGTEQWFLVDIVSGELQELGSLGLGQDSARPCAFSSDPILLCGKAGVYLLDVDAGEMSDTPIELDPTNPVPPQVEWVSPDEAYFLVRVPGEAWLVPAATPAAARQLGLAQRVTGATLSHDHAFVIYAERTEEGGTQVVKERVDGSDSDILLSDPEIERAVWVPKQDQLILIRREWVSLYSLDDQAEHKLFEPIDVVRTVRVDPEGQKAVVGVGGFETEEVAWTYVNLEAKTTEKLAELNGYHKIFGPYGPASPRWLFLTDVDFQEEQDHIASLDLQTGEVHRHVSWKDVVHFHFAHLTQDGRVGLVFAAKKTGGMQLWLLVAERDEAVLLAEATTISGSLSADGEWVVLSVDEKRGERVMTIKRVATDSGEEQVVGEGFIGVWAKP